MNAAKRALVTGLMAAALLTTSLGFTIENAHAEKKVDESFAVTCNQITRDTNTVVNEYNNPSTSAARRAELLEQYRGLLASWRANGCDQTFGSLPLMKPPMVPDLQTVGELSHDGTSGPSVPGTQQTSRPNAASR